MATIKRNRAVGLPGRSGHGAQINFHSTFFLFLQPFIAVEKNAV